MAPTPTAFVFGDGTVGALDGYVVGIFATTGGDSLAELVAAQGAEVLSTTSRDLNAASRLLDAVAHGGVDGVALLDLAVARELLSAIGRLRTGGELRTALRGRTLVAAADTAIADCLAAAGISASVPRDGGAGTDAEALAQLLVEQIPALRRRLCVAAGHELEVRSQAVVIDGTLRQLPASAMGLLRALAQQPGHVVTREKLLALLPGERVSGHAVDVAIGRLRTALGDPAIVATVVKRGYRLAVS
jgi:uroporphyrinogen-III synthase